MPRIMFNDLPLQHLSCKAWTNRDSSTMFPTTRLKTACRTGWSVHRRTDSSSRLSQTAIPIFTIAVLYQNAEMDQPDFLDHFLGCQAPLSAKSQKETFQSIIEETLDSSCDFSTVMTIQENLNTMIEERKDDPEPVVLDKHEVKTPARNQRRAERTA